MQRKSAHFVLVFTLLCSTVFAQSSSNSFRDTADGSLDMSNFLLSVSGFLPVPVIITEPAVGYGAGLFGAYFHKKKSNSETIERPDISVAGGGATDSKTWFAGGGHMGYWRQGRIRYVGALFYANPKLTFYPTLLNREIALNVTMSIPFLYQSISFKLGKSKWFAGGQYLFYATNVKLTNADLYPVLKPILEELEVELINSGVGAQVFYDSRDKIYTPNKGIYWKNNFRYFPTWLGSTEAYGMLSTDFIWFFPVVKNRYHMGLRNTASLVFDDAPFYTNPFINMRGVKAMRYQGEFVNTFQVEGRLRVYKRWSLMGFGGVGNVSKSLSNFNLEDGVWAGGTGFRYLLARLFNLQAGLDFAWSEKDPLTGRNQFAFYITVGSAWMN